MSTIIVTHENNEVDEFDFAKDQVVTIGRRSSNDVCIPNLSVSGKHAQISFEDNEAWIEDLNSTNGTYINGRLIARQKLHHDDEIIMGKVRLNYLADNNDADSIAAAATQPAEVETPTNNQHIEKAYANAAEDNNEFNDDVENEDSMSLSDKARVALGREPSERPTLHTVAASAGAAAAVSAAGKHYEDSAVAEAEAPILRNEVPAAKARGEQTETSQSSDSQQQNNYTETPEPRPAKTGGHPLDGLSEDDLQQPMHELDSPPTTSRGAVIEIKNGAKSGQILPIDKPVTTLGRPGIQIAAIMRKPDGYFLMHIESDDSVDRPTLNRDAIGDEPVMLHSGDELNVAGIDVEFMLS